jgi:hypothetical protein
MRSMKQEDNLSWRFAGNNYLLGVALMICITGCSGNPASNATSGTQAQSQKGPQTYFASTTAGTANGGLLHGPEVYVIDDFSNVFSQSTYQVNQAQEGAQVINYGVTTGLPHGLLNLGTSANYVATGSAFVPTTYNPPKSGGFAVELAGQAGGLVQLAGQPVTPVVAAVQCPSFKAAQTYQFLTIPAPLLNLENAATWNPAVETAYGSVDISSNDSTFTFDNIRQFTLPSVGGPGTPAQPASGPVTGVCSPTFFGNTISLPNPLILSDPLPGTSNPPPSATIGIGPTGLLVEDNRSSSSGVYSGLGAGSGAIGLPKPANSIDTTAVVGAQYLGFVYSTGVNSKTVVITSWSSHLTSFGFPTIPASCASVAASTSTLIYGGDFSNDNPSSSPNGVSNCDLAIDLGGEDASNSGLYPHATVWVGSGYAAKLKNTAPSFPAVAIAGQLQGKFAIFLVGQDSVQPWAIYLLQSN